MVTAVLLHQPTNTNAANIMNEKQSFRLHLTLQTKNLGEDQTSQRRTYHNEHTFLSINTTSPLLHNTYEGILKVKCDNVAMSMGVGRHGQGGNLPPGNVAKCFVEWKPLSRPIIDALISQFFEGSEYFI